MHFRRKRYPGRERKRDDIPRKWTLIFSGLTSGAPDEEPEYNFLAARARFLQETNEGGIIKSEAWGASRIVLAE